MRAAGIGMESIGEEAVAGAGKLFDEPLTETRQQP
jgi:hypothetical protein